MDSEIEIPQLPNANLFLIVLIPLWVITTICVFLRCWTRSKIINVWGWDDTMIIAAALTYTVTNGLGIAIVVNVAKGSLRYGDFLNLVNICITSEIFYMVTVVFFKASLIILFWRLVQSRRQRLILEVSLALTIIFGAFHTTWIIFQCGVPKSAQTIFLNSLSGKCIAPKASIMLNYVHSSINLATDAILVIISIPTTWRTQLSFREKIVLTFLFGLVALSFTATAVRMIWINDLTSFQLDFFRHTGWLLLWSSVECGVGITIGCLITLRKFFRHILQSATTLIERTGSTLEQNHFGAGRGEDRCSDDNSQVASTYPHIHGTRHEDGEGSDLTLLSHIRK